MRIIASNILFAIGKISKVGQNRRMYTIDFDRYFFPSPKAAQIELDCYHKLLNDFENLNGKVAASSDQLLHALQLFENIMEQFVRHYTYYYLRYAIDTTDHVSNSMCSKLESEFDGGTAFLRQELANLDPMVFDQFVDQKPELESYRYAVESTQRFRPHILSLEVEMNLNKMAVSNSWEYELYESLVQRTRFGKVKTPQGELDVLKQRAALATYPDRAVRAAGFKELYAGYASQRDLYAFSLINLVKRRNRLAQIHHFQDAPDEVYFNSYWSRAEVTRLLEQIEQQAQLYIAYQQLRAEHARNVLAVEEPCPWDITVSEPGELPVHFSIEQASATIQEALKCLGPEYSRELASLLDPANGRLDILPGVHRKAGGFSKGFPGISAVFFSHGFTGYYNDMRVLMHESTHAVHRQLMNNHNVRAIYAEGPHYLFESFAILNELLLADYLYNQETHHARRTFYLEQFLEGKGMALFFIAQDATLEQSIYNEVEQGRIESANDLDALTERISRQFDIWTGRHPELKMRWITNRLFYEDPLYNINYVYGSLLALKYYQLLTEDQGTFVDQYVSLMCNGFTMPPDCLISKFLNFNLNDPDLLKTAVQILKNKVSSLEEEYLRESLERDKDDRLST